MTLTSPRRTSPLLKNMSAKIAALPMIMITLAVFVGCTAWTITYSFTHSKLIPSTHKWVGFDQYKHLWNNVFWLQSIENIFLFGFISFMFIIVVSFVMAALLDQKIRFEDTFRTIFLYPYALSLIVTGLVWQWILNPDLGMQNFIRNLGFDNFEFNPLYNSDTVLFVLAAAGIWQGTGFIMCLMLAGLRTVDEDVWKAIRVDGIGIIRAYLFVIIPMMSPVFLTIFVIVTAGIVKTYDLVVAMTSGGPGLASVMPTNYVYDKMFGGQDLGQSFAASTMMLAAVVTILIPLILIKLCDKRRL